MPYRVARYARPTSRFEKYVNVAAKAAKFAYDYGGAYRQASHYGSRGGRAPVSGMPTSNVYGLVPSAKKRRVTVPSKSRASRRPPYKSKYVGKFRKGRKTRADPALTKGFVNTTEINGTCTDPNVIYIGVSSISGIQTVEVIMQSLLRKLFQKQGRVITNVHQIINANPFWSLRFVNGFASTATVNTNTYPLVGTDTIYTICGDVLNGVTATFTAWKVIMLEIAKGINTDTDENTVIPLRLELLDTGSPSFGYNLDLTNEFVHYKASADVKMQNRSLSTTGSGDSENTSANPLQGYRYDISGGMPRWRDSSDAALANLFNTVIDTQGVLLIRGAQFTTTSSAVNREPPNPKMFANCKSSAKIYLQPGSIKRFNVKYRKSSLLIDFLHGIGAGVGLTNRASSRLTGKMVLVAFEDMINVNADESINIAYEVNRVFSAYCTTGKVKPALGQFYTGTLNNP